MNQAEIYYNSLLNLAGQITTAFSMVPIIAGLFFWNYFNKPLKVIFLFLSFRLFINLLIELFIWSVNTYYNIFWKPILTYLKIDNALFFNGLYYLNTIIFVGLFYYILNEKQKNKSLLKKFLAFCVCFEVINFFFIDGFRSVGIYGPVLINCLSVILPSYYLWWLSNDPPNLPISKNSYFWISIALFLPHLISLIFIFTADMLYETNFILYCKAHMVSNLFEIFSQLGFLYAFMNAKYVKYL
jgi:hypothetical protein